MADYGGHAAQMPGDDGMIVMAGSFKSSGVPAGSGESSGKVRASWRTAGTIRYNGYATSGWRLRYRRPHSQSILSRGKLMQAWPKIVKKHHRVTNAAPTLRNRLVSKHNSSVESEKEKQPCTDL